MTTLTEPLIEPVYLTLEAALAEYHEKGMVFYGVGLSEVGEDGDFIMALGHVDLRRFSAAFIKYARTIWGFTYADHTQWGAWEEPAIQHIKATATVNDEYGAWFSWSKEAQEHPAAIPVTVWHI